MNKRKINNQNLRKQLATFILNKLEHFKYHTPKNQKAIKAFDKMYKKGGKKFKIFRNKYLSLGLPVVEFEGDKKTKQLVLSLYHKYYCIVIDVEYEFGRTNLQWLWNAPADDDLILDINFNCLESFEKNKTVKKRFHRKPRLDRNDLVSSIKGKDFVLRREYEEDEITISKTVDLKKRGRRSKDILILKNGKEIVTSSGKPHEVKDRNVIEEAVEKSLNDTHFSKEEIDPDQVLYNNDCNNLINKTYRVLDEKSKKK